MPGFVKTKKDEKLWKKAKKQADKKTRKGSQSFYAYANAVFHRMKGKKNEANNYPQLQPQKHTGMTRAHGPDVDHEDFDNTLTTFQTWFNQIDEKDKSETDKLLTPVKRCKHDSTKERQKGADGKPIFPKADRVTVWGCPPDKNYVRN